MSPRSRKSKDRKTRAGRAPKSFETLEPRAAGIDLGSREHFVAGPPHPDGAPNVKSFGTTTPELRDLADWLAGQGVVSVAMESTGVYWIPLFEILDARGVEVLLVNARQVRGVPGRKTDILDCQWLQMLHRCGLLRGSFRPADGICALRAVVRERNGLVAERSDWVRRMQKCLDQMNVCVHHAVSDITGVTGMAIIRAIVGGERDPAALARLRDPRCRKSPEQIARELTGNWRGEHLFNLTQALRMYDHICAIIDEYDARILSIVESLQPAGNRDLAVPDHASQSKAKSIRKRGGEPLREALYRIGGADLTSIDGISVNTSIVVLSEIGWDLSAFPDEQSFVAYLRLAPNLAVSAGKTVKAKCPSTTCTRVSAALRMAALTLRHSDTALGAYYRRIARRKGASVAVFSTARKLAQIIFRMLRYGQQYVDVGTAEYEARFRDKQIKHYTQSLNEMGFKVIPMPETECAS